MQIATFWQPSYTPKRIIRRPEIVRTRKKQPPRRAYISFSRSQTAQQIMSLIEQGDGLTVLDLIGKTGKKGTWHYVKTLMCDGLIYRKAIHVTYATQKVNHYWAAT